MVALHQKLKIKFESCLCWFTNGDYKRWFETRKCSVANFWDLIAYYKTFFSRQINCMQNKLSIKKTIIDLLELFYFDYQGCMLLRTGATRSSDYSCSPLSDETGVFLNIQHEMYMYYLVWNTCDQSFISEVHIMKCEFLLFSKGNMVSTLLDHVDCLHSETPVMSFPQMCAILFSSVTMSFMSG